MGVFSQKIGIFHLVLNLVSVMVFADSTSLSSIVLNASTYDLRMLSSSNCDLYHHPPKPACPQLDDVAVEKLPVIVAQWKLDTSGLVQKGFCYYALNITYVCDYRCAIFSSTYILDNNPVVWPWIDHPTDNDLISSVKSGFIGEKPKSICSWPHLTETTSLVKGVIPCSVTTTASGIVTDTDFKHCDLKVSDKCLSQNNFTYFRPIPKRQSFKSCPTSLDSVDIGIMEKVQLVSKEQAIVISTHNTKRLFHWKATPSPIKKVCTDVTRNVAIYKDEGGYLVSLESLEGNRLSPMILASPAYLSNWNRNFSYTPENLQGLFKTYKSKIDRWMIKGTRKRREAGDGKWSLAYLLGEFLFNNMFNNNRKRRDTSDLDMDITGGVSDLQMSFLRAEMQHDFHLLSKWLNNNIQTLYSKICNDKLKRWIRASISDPSAENMLQFLSEEPYKFLIPSSGTPQVCVATIISPTAIFKIPIPPTWELGNIKIVSATNETYWLTPNLGILLSENLELVKVSPGTPFFIPLKGGCSIDLKSSLMTCSKELDSFNIPTSSFFHTAGPMYSPEELSMLLREPSRTQYDLAVIPFDTPDSTTEVHLTGEWFWSVFSPLTAFWKLFSPNMWTFIYIVMFSLISIKVLVIYFARSHSNKLKLIYDNEKSKPPISDPEPHRPTDEVGYKRIGHSFLTEG